MKSFKRSWQLFFATLRLTCRYPSTYAFVLGLFFAEVMAFLMIFGGIFLLYHQLPWAELIKPQVILAHRWSYLLAFLIYYLCFRYLVVLFDSMTMIRAWQCLNGERKNLLAAVWVALKRAGRILWWSLFDSTIGIVLNVVETPNNWLGRFHRKRFGARWWLAYPAILPCMIFKQKRVLGAWREIGYLITRHWGDFVQYRSGLGWAFSLLSLPIVILLFLMFYHAEFWHIWCSILVGYAVVYGLIASVVNAVIHLIFYRYLTTKKVPPEFSSELLDTLIR